MALVVNFNTPSQLGIAPSTNPSDCRYWPNHQMHCWLYSTLLNYEEEEMIRDVSYHPPLTQSQSQSVSYHSH